LHRCKHQSLHPCGHQASTGHAAPGGLPRRLTMISAHRLLVRQGHVDGPRPATLSTGPPRGIGSSSCRAEFLILGAPETDSRRHRFRRWVPELSISRGCVWSTLFRCDCDQGLPASRICWPNRRWQLHPPTEEIDFLKACAPRSPRSRYFLGDTFVEHGTASSSALWQRCRALRACHRARPFPPHFDARKKRNEAFFV
jgi:hypothetical protein